MKVIHLELEAANRFVEKIHRHHKPVTGHRFSLGALHLNDLVGVAIIGRPVARNTNQITTLEVSRLATDGTKNACSFLYAAAARAGLALGFREIQTFILECEPGTSLIAAGWKKIALSSGGNWNREERGGRRIDQPLGPKVKYGKTL